MPKYQHDELGNEGENHMQTTQLGRTRLRVTVAGLGTGGHSRVGIAQGEEHAAKIVRAAYDAGVNFFDTSAVYGTEAALGTGLAGIARDGYILSTKFPYKDKQGAVHKPEVLMAALENSLKLLRVDCVDIYHLHALVAEDYAQASETLFPAMIKAKEQGKLRFFGATELFSVDTGHEMFARALKDDFFDVIMVGYNLLNPSAAERVFPITMEKGVGVLCMFAVRSALSNPEKLGAEILRMAETQQIDEALVGSVDILDFLTENGAARSIMEAAYRFCRHTPGIDVTLTGTGSLDHLHDNLRSIEMPPLPGDILGKLRAMFGRVDCVSGN